MPFVYYGGKKGSAHRYPPPGFSTIIEPFAGSAGYALAWAKPSTRVILIEKDPVIVGLWRRLQAPDAASDLAATNCPPVGEPCPDRLVGFTTGSPTVTRVTEWVHLHWPAQRERFLRALPVIRDWRVVEGDYADAPDERATWFVDPPYAPQSDGRQPGSSYPNGSDDIDYAALADWCRARRGQVIVCEQEGADWLPFRPMYRYKPMGGSGGPSARPQRVEVVWSRTPGRFQPGTRTHAAAEEARKVRRRERTRRR